ncbi:hypothetical protein ES288_D07G148900v1 [Gossypium darwinii]|uniref:Peptidase M16 C-terminal domain-containing protein n=3 Tax=Gossypium TaxID=3633 RepID=A0A5D2K7S3_GOSTO|nr:hypothetical protein ES288_D07G148900v1 [Gossypium darwinii]TYH62829.1 hypothetical protein ES332_D07G146900v1 [Gossypium tomentosum]
MGICSQETLRSSWRTRRGRLIQEGATEKLCFRLLQADLFLAPQILAGIERFNVDMSLVDAIEKGIDLRKQILELYNDYYHGGLMKLVVIGGESLDILQHWVVELFSDIRQGSQGKPEFKVEGPVWRASKLYRLEAVKDVHILELRMRYMHFSMWMGNLYL